MSSFKTPTQQQIDTAVQRMHSPEFAAYFLSRLENPHWIEPLSQQGFFKDPPSGETTSQRKSYPHWPASKYLARMAAKVPMRVANVLSQIQTDNPSVNYDLIQAALAMPSSVASSLVPSISFAARERLLWVAFKDACELCARLAESGEVEAALELADGLFAPTPAAVDEHQRRGDDYWYIEGLEKAVAALAVIKADLLLPRLCNWLTAAIEAKRFRDKSVGDDYSHIWRPAIEEHPQNHDFDFAGQLVGCVRSGFEKAISSKQLDLSESLRILKGYPYLVYKRLRIHLINECGDDNLDLVCQTIMSSELFDDYRYKHEYGLLVSKRLYTLSTEDRSKWFAWIEEGPDMSDYDASIQANLGRAATDDDRRNRIQYWQYEKLHCVKDQLEGKWKSLHDKMLTEHGPPMPTGMGASRIQYGDESPMTVEDLASLSFEEAVEKVSSWQPEKSDFWGPNVDGLAATFTHYVASNPEEFSKSASSLIGRPARFIRGFLGQMSEEVKAGHPIALKAVLELSEWVVEQPFEEQSEQDDESLSPIDNSWRWTRDQISELLENVCKAKTEDKPWYSLDDYRDIVWKLIESLTQDSPESNLIRDVSAEDSRVHEYLDLGMNSSRGKTVEAALEYARWVANHIKKADGELEAVPGGFGAMPEVKELLEWLIAEENRSVTTLSIIGSRIGLIHWIDKSWLQANTAQLFQLEEPSAQGWAAWNAFLVWVSPHVEFYKLFKYEFAYAVGQSAKVQLPEQSREQPMHHLGEHLMILYGRGQLGMDDDRGLLRKFLTETNPDIRRHAIGFVGGSMEGDKKVPIEVVGQFQTLWDVYWKGLGPTDATERPGSRLFGTWFVSKQFPDVWALQKLAEFVQIDPKPQPDYHIGQRLGEIAHVDIEKAVRILDLMVHGDQEGWRIYGWKDAAYSILEQAMKSPDNIRQQAERLIDYFGRRGYTEFGALLEIRGAGTKGESSTR